MRNKRVFLFVFMMSVLMLLSGFFWSKDLSPEEQKQVDALNSELDKAISSKNLSRVASITKDLNEKHSIKTGREKEIVALVNTAIANAKDMAAFTEIVNSKKTLKTAGVFFGWTLDKKKMAKKLREQLISIVTGIETVDELAQALSTIETLEKDKTYTASLSVISAVSNKAATLEKIATTGKLKTTLDAIKARSNQLGIKKSQGNKGGGDGDGGGDSSGGGGGGGGGGDSGGGI